jgi:ATP-dependent 26S proteasome regulatory subunit
VLKRVKCSLNHVESSLNHISSVHCSVTLFDLQVVASAIVDKYIGESARVIREMFGYAKDHQPCIIFMDEVSCTK